MSTPRIPIEERFWSKVLRSDGCWTWVGVKTRKGYGFLGRGGAGAGNVLAHRLSWVIHNSRAIPAGLMVLHRCDNPSCVNPAHLFLGTHRDNLADMRAKGRSLRGEKNPASKLTTAEVLAIVKLRSEGKSVRQLAAQFGVIVSCIEHVCSGRNWSSVTGITFESRS